MQNSLARVVDPSVRRHHHITPALKKLHWLPIHQRIHFKIATLTFKTLQNFLPSYLSDLLTMGGVYQELGDAKHPQGRSKVLILMM